MRILPLLTVTVVVAAGAAQATVTPIGGPVDVSKCPTCGERRPGLAASATQFLTGFEAGTPTEPAGVFARLTLANGKPKAKSFLANPPSPFDAERSAVIATYSGGFLMAYESLTPQNNSNVFVLRISNAGVPVGAPILVKTEDLTKPTSETQPSIAAKSDGSFVVAWATTALAGGTSAPAPPSIEARWFNAAGAPVGTPVKLNTALVNAGHPVVCIDSTGLAVIAFPTIDEVKPFEPSKQGVAVRRLAATGAIQGAQVTVANPLGRQTGVGLSCGLNGSFVVAWASDLAPATDLGDILFATYDKTAKRVGSVAKLPTTNTGTQEAPYLQHDSKGNLIAVWESESTLGRAIRGLRIRANGVVDGTDFLVVDKSSVSTRVTHPLLAFFGTTANFVVTWDEGSRNVFFRRYKTN